jgi:hypothetical protein
MADYCNSRDFYIQDSIKNEKVRIKDAKDRAMAFAHGLDFGIEFKVVELSDGWRVYYTDKPKDVKVKEEGFWKKIW